MNMAKLRSLAEVQQYPGNQDYDPETLAPRGITADRVDVMQRNMPQLLAGGNSLLDVGSNKGFVSLLLRDRYREIDGYEPDPLCYCIAEMTRRHHLIDHVRFINAPFRHIPLDKSFNRPYDVVYAGSVHHHLFKDALLHHAPPFLPLAKLAGLAGTFLVLDGPFDVDGDYSLKTWAEQFGWDPQTKARCSVEHYAEALKPQFELVHGPLVNERNRETVVFERVAPDMPCLEMTQCEIDELKTVGVECPANQNRSPGAVLRKGARRYKFDCKLQPDAVLRVLSKLPEWFARTYAVLVQDGTRIGDVSAWIDGPAEENPHTLWVHWLRMNHVLACVGLVEIHFKPSDYKRIGDCGLVDVDVDMVNSAERLFSSKRYLDKWREVVTEALGPRFAAVVDYVRYHLRDEWVFKHALDQTLTIDGEVT
jgi:hypothetical protein